MTSVEATEHWTRRLAELATATRVPGAVLGILADGHETVVAHGVLSTATQVPVTTDAVFQVGSITKPWTGTMIMQLVDEGRLSLDTTVAQALPGIKLGAADVAGRVTSGDASGDNFVCRSHSAEPWSTVSFGVLDGGPEYLFSAGRVTLRA